MKDRVEVLREILSLVKSELNEFGPENGVGYTMPDEKYHIFIYLDNADDEIYVIEPNKVVDGAHEPIGENYLATYNDSAELLLGCEWCMETFERDERMVLVPANSVGDPQIKFDLGSAVLVAEPNTDKDYKEIIVGLMDHDDTYIQDLAVIGPAYSYGKNNEVVLSNKNVNMRVYSDKNSDDYTHNFTVGIYEEPENLRFTFNVDYLHDNKECSFCVELTAPEKPNVGWLAERISEHFSSLYAGDDFIKAVNSIYCIDLLVEKNGEFVDHDEVSGGDVKNIIEKVERPLADSFVHKGDAALFDGSFKYWSNACGDLHRNGKEDITEDELPEPLKRAYKELWGEDLYSNLCYLVETADGYGVALINEYDDFTTSIKGCSKEDLFELVQADKELVIAAPGFENAKVYAGDYTGFDECHELIVVFPADTPFEEFDNAAKALEHIAYTSVFDRTKTNSLDNQIKAAAALSSGSFTSTIGKSEIVRD